MIKAFLFGGLSVKAGRNEKIKHQEPKNRTPDPDPPVEYLNVSPGSLVSDGNASGHIESLTKYYYNGV
jgi:hypothetical protein